MVNTGVRENDHGWRGVYGWWAATLSEIVRIWRARRQFIRVFVGRRVCGHGIRLSEPTSQINALTTFAAKRPEAKRLTVELTITCWTALFVHGR